MSRHRGEATTFTLTVDGTPLTVGVWRGRFKNVNARLVGSKLQVSAPGALAERDLHRIVAEQARTLLRRRRGRELDRHGRLLQLARRVAQRFPQRPEVATVEFSSLQRALWGSYSAATGTVRLNATLAAMPAWVLEAVMAHELAHAVHRQHSPAFWALLRSVCPETDRARAFLAGVSWLARRWSALSPDERAQLGASDLAGDGVDG